MVKGASMEGEKASRIIFKRMGVNWDNTCFIDFSRDIITRTY